METVWAQVGDQWVAGASQREAQAGQPHQAQAAPCNGYCPLAPWSTLGELGGLLTPDFGEKVRAAPGPSFPAGRSGHGGAGAASASRPQHLTPLKAMTVTG